MKANRERLELAMAEACMSVAALQRASGLPRPTLNNVIGGRNVRPATLGKVARALGVEPVMLLEKGEK